MTVPQSVGCELEQIICHSFPTCKQVTMPTPYGDTVTNLHA